MLTIGTGLADARACLALSAAHAGVIWASAGLDPFACFDAGEAFAGQLSELEALLGEGGFAALGEIGLEYHHPLSPRPAQRVHLERQLALATRLGLPAILHVREAHQDMLPLLREHPRASGVVHSFDGGPAEAEGYLALGWHLALNGMATFKGRDALRAAVPLIPDDRILIETDSPFLAPVPVRGQRCEPAFVTHSLVALAALRGQDVGALAARTTANAERLFRLGARAP